MHAAKQNVYRAKWIDAMRAWVKRTAEARAEKQLQRIETSYFIRQNLIREARAAAPKRRR